MQTNFVLKMTYDFITCVIKKVFYKLLKHEYITHHTHNIKWPKITTYKKLILYALYNVRRKN